MKCGLGTRGRKRDKGITWIEGKDAFHTMAKLGFRLIRVRECGQMENMGGYYETNKVADILGLPVTVTAMNVMVNGVHWHDHLEILFCKKGEMHVRVDRTEYTLAEGDFITVNSGDSHEIYGGEPGNLQIICSVENKLLGDMQGKRIRCSTVGERCVGEEDAGLVRQALAEMAFLSILDVEQEEWGGTGKAGKTAPGKQCGTGKVWEAGAEGRCGTGKQRRTEQGYREQLGRIHPLRQEENWNRYHMYMYQLLMVLVRCKAEGEGGKQRKQDLHMLDACVSYINAHLGEALDAGTLAGELHVSESTVYRIFSRQMGMSLNQYITMVRVNAACRCLEESEDKITDIAYSCGFTGLSNFYRAFQLYTGMTPKGYRSSRWHAGTRMAFWQPDIMKLNKYQSFYELGIRKEWVRRNAD